MLKLFFITSLLLTTAGCASSAPSPEALSRLERYCPAGKVSDADLAQFLKSPSVRVMRERAPSGTPVKLYGASWCGACGLARLYMNQRHIPFVEIDADDDGPGKRAFHEALDAAELPQATTLPVVDARGVVMVGFFPCALEAAWATD